MNRGSNYLYPVQISFIQQKNSLRQFGIFFLNMLINVLRVNVSLESSKFSNNKLIKYLEFIYKHYK